MKKRYLALVMAAALMVPFTGCNKEEGGTGAVPTPTATGQAGGTTGDTTPTTTPTIEPAEPTVALNLDLSSYATLGEYKGIEYKAYVTDATEDEIRKDLEGYISSNNLLVEADRAVKKGDYVVISFTGKIDGKSDSNLSGESNTLNIGSGDFIPGFEDGLVGHKKDEEVVLNLKFPDDYHNADYAKKDVEFTVKIEKVQEIPEITDELIKKNFGADSTLAYGWEDVASAKEAVKKEIEDAKKSAADSYKRVDVLAKLVEGCTYKELPQELVDEYYDVNIDYYQSYADYLSEMYGTEMTLAGYAETFMGMSLEELEKQCKEYAEDAVKEDIALWLVADAEGIDITDEKYKEEVDELFETYSESYGYTESSQFVEANGGEETVRLRLRIIEARNWLVENAKQNGTFTERE